LPGEDGYSLIRSIRRGGIEQKQRPLPALALTAYARSEDQEQALDAGFEAYAAKPIEPDELIRTVARLSGRSA
jgi:CheY-like chemotaxis protein